MAAQDVRELVPRVRRAIEGPVPLDTGALSDDQLLALTADCIADIILMTVGKWGHTLYSTSTDPATGVTEYEVDPPLSLPEQSMVAWQAAVSYFFFRFAGGRTSERTRQADVEVEWAMSAQVLRDWLNYLIGQRDTALAVVQQANPVMARYASILEVRDRVASVLLEPWVGGGLGGGQPIIP
jgi:hypothetical protein